MSSQNKDQKGLHGHIEDETMKTVLVNGKLVQKKGTVFRVKLNGKNVDIDGDYIIARPEDRIKKNIKKW